MFSLILTVENFYMICYQNMNRFEYFYLIWTCVEKNAFMQHAIMNMGNRSAS